MLHRVANNNFIIAVYPHPLVREKTLLYGNTALIPSIRQTIRCLDLVKQTSFDSIVFLITREYDLEPGRKINVAKEALARIEGENTILYDQLRRTDKASFLDCCENRKLCFPVDHGVNPAFVLLAFGECITKPEYTILAILLQYRGFTCHNPNGMVAKCCTVDFKQHIIVQRRFRVPNRPALFFHMPFATVQSPPQYINRNPVSVEIYRFALAAKTERCGLRIMLDGKRALSAITDAAWLQHMKAGSNAKYQLINRLTRFHILKDDIVN